MANNKSALKRHRQNLKRRAGNVAVRSSLKTAIKKVREAVDNKETEDIRNLLAQAVRLIDKAVSKGILHKNNASRNVSRLTRSVNSLG